MTLRTRTHLIEVLREIRLLSPDRLAELRYLCPGHSADARSLARSMVQRGWLTVYQVNQLLEGQGHHLVLGPYHMLDQLGQGGQSRVFKARHTEYQWIVALKVIRPDEMHGRQAARLFLREMEAMARLDHPNIVQFWDADQVDEQLYCAMEYVEGTDLGKYVRLMGPLPIAEASDYIRQTALGLQHAHEHNLIHRDIKPVNLCLTATPGPLDLALLRRSDSLVKILDWGLACLRPTCATPDAGERSESGKTVIGTADYLSPDQARDPSTADIRSDIYSLGCTFYYLLAGQPPFPAGTLAQKLMQQQQAEPQPVEELNPVVTPELSAVLRRMLAKQPQDRYQTPAAVALALLPFCCGPLASISLPRTAVRTVPA